MKFAIKALKIFIALSLVFISVYVFVNWESIAGLLKAKSSSNSPTQYKKTQLASKVLDTAKSSTTGQNAKVVLTGLRAEADSQFANDWLYYPALSIEAPVEWQVATEDVERMMPDNLINAKGSAMPAENGDMLIAGHSSYYSWSKGKYKHIFAPLVGAKIGDSVVLKHKDLTNFYQVADIFEINGDGALDLHVGGTYKKNLYLMTCVPVGTSWKRLIIRADYIKSI